MPIDSRDKRASVHGYGGDSSMVAPLPDGGLDQADRQHVSGRYRGILAGEEDTAAEYADLDSTITAQPLLTYTVTRQAALSLLTTPQATLARTELKRARLEATNNPQARLYNVEEAIYDD